MKTYTEQLNELWEQMRATIIEKIETIGTDSEVIAGTKTIKLSIEEFYYKTDLGILTEIGVDNIFDDDGYTYGYGALSHEELAQLTDHVINIELPKFNNDDLSLDFQKIKSFDLPIAVSKEFDINLDYPFALDVEDSSYFYTQEKERDEDFEKLKQLLS